jgi:hypothetical protein
LLYLCYTSRNLASPCSTIPLPYFALLSFAFAKHHLAKQCPATPLLN